MRVALLTLASLVLAPIDMAKAQSAAHPAVIELFTSQGCSSCPPADEVLAEVAQRDDVIALALHVDYWDYIGWKDTFSDPAFAERQRAYARAAGKKMIYTPQMVVNGAEMLVGSNRGKLASMLSSTNATTAPDLHVSRNGNILTVTASSDEPLPEGTTIDLVRYIPSAMVAIESGENAGRSILYTNIVTSWRQVGTWNGQDTLSMTVAAKGELPAVIILQSPGTGPILAAAVAK